MAFYFLTLFTLFSRNHANIDKSKANHETNVAWFVKSNRQKLEFNNKLKGDSQVWDIFGNWKPFKNDEKFFLFHLKSLFRSQDIKLLFWFIGHV